MSQHTAEREGDGRVPRRILCHHRLTTFPVQGRLVTARCSCGEEWGPDPLDTVRRLHAAHKKEAPVSEDRDPTDPELDDLRDYGDIDGRALHVVETDPPAMAREPIPLRSTTGHATQADVMAGAMAVVMGAHADDLPRDLRDAIDEGTTKARHLEDMDHAAQAIVDAADEWEAAEGGVDEARNLADAVLAWRAVRDGAPR